MPTSKPLLSIITVCRNEAARIRKTAESVVGQTNQDFEWIVIDGASTDETVEVLNEYRSRTTYFVSEPDGGIYEAMNKGLRVAQGEYVYFLNSGDELAAPDVLERAFVRNEPPADILYGDSLRPDGSGGWKELPQPDEWTVALFFGMGICHQTLFYKKGLFDTLGGYDERYRIIADWDFNFRVLLAGRSTRHLPFPVVRYAGGGISATRVAEMEAEKEAMRQQLLPRAIRRDYERLKALEAECARLKKYEDWVEQIRKRSVWVNWAMAAKWGWEKWTRRGAHGKGGDSE